MRNEFDTIVIGGGLSGLVAAIISGRKGKKTAIITKGAGTLTIGGGIVDLLGYTEKGVVRKPFEALGELAPTHPYNLIGAEKMRQALDFFTEFTKAGGYPYTSFKEGRSSWLPTAIGTIKPTFLRPEGMNPENLMRDRIVVMGVDGLKDFFPELLIKGLSHHPWYSDKDFSAVRFTYKDLTARDLSALDIARFVDKPTGKKWLLDNMKSLIPPGSALIMPPILGTKPQTDLRKQIFEELSITCMETSVIPPSVTGLRLRQLLMDEVKRLGLTYIEMAEVKRAELSGKKVKAVFTVAPDKERRYAAENFVIATGGFFGGGVIAAPGKAWEAVLEIDLRAPTLQEDWSQERVFSSEPHAFGLMGVSTDSELYAIDEGGARLYENVRFCGRTLGGYDPNREKSGNGVALCTGFVAGDL